MEKPKVVPVDFQRRDGGADADAENLAADRV